MYISVYFRCILVCFSVNTKQAWDMKYETKTGGETRKHSRCFDFVHNEAAEIGIWIWVLERERGKIIIFSFVF